MLGQVTDVWIVARDTLTSPKYCELCVDLKVILRVSNVTLSCEFFHRSKHCVPHLILATAYDDKSSHSPPLKPELGR